MKLQESLKYLDMEHQITPMMSVDEFKSTLGDDSEMIVLTFIVNHKQVAIDLASWFERGYEWIASSETSPGEVLDNKWYVFVEMKRTTTAPRRITELLQDLYTLTGIKPKDWEIKIEGEKYPASIKNMEKHMILSSTEYERLEDKDLNEWREIAGIKHKNTSSIQDEDILDWQRKAGII